MMQNDDAQRSEGIIARLHLDNIIVKHVLAWVLLIIIGTTVWKMVHPIIPKEMLSTVIGESTETASNESTQSAKNETPKKETPKKKQDSLSFPTGTDRVQVIATALKVRSEPDINSDKITTLSKGTVVQVLDRKGQWLEIKTVTGEVGYIKASPEYVRAAP